MKESCRHIVFKNTKLNLWNLSRSKQLRRSQGLYTNVRIIDSKSLTTLWKIFKLDYIKDSAPSDRERIFSMYVKSFETLLERRRLQKLSSRIGSMLWITPLVAFLFVWEFVSRAGLFPADKVPAFTTVLATLWKCLAIPSFTLMVLTSFLNLTTGILAALLFALPLALTVGLRNRVDIMLTPMIMLIGALPDLAILPLMVMWFGPGNAAAIMMCAICAFFPIYFTVREGTKGIPPDYFHVATVFKTGKFSKLAKVILPSIFPNLVTGLRLSFDFVWEIILAIEIIARVTGIGTFIDSSVSAGSVEYAFAGILAVGMIAISVDRLVFRTLENRIARWR